VDEDLSDGSGRRDAEEILQMNDLVLHEEEDLDLVPAREEILSVEEDACLARGGHPAAEGETQGVSEHLEVCACEEKKGGGELQGLHPCAPTCLEEDLLMETKGAVVPLCLARGGFRLRFREVWRRGGLSLLLEGEDLLEEAL